MLIVFLLFLESHIGYIQANNVRKCFKKYFSFIRNDLVKREARYNVSSIYVFVINNKLLPLPDSPYYDKLPDTSFLKNTDVSCSCQIRPFNSKLPDTSPEITTVLFRKDVSGPIWPDASFLKNTVVILLADKSFNYII